MEDFARPHIEGSPYGHRVHIHIGDAKVLVPRMDVQWDMAFVDADKREYVDYYEMILPRLRPGGYILADNTLWYGRITEEARESDLQTLGLQRFNDLVAADDRVEKRNTAAEGRADDYQEEMTPGTGQFLMALRSGRTSGMAFNPNRSLEYNYQGNTTNNYHPSLVRWPTWF